MSGLHFGKPPKTPAPSLAERFGVAEPSFLIFIEIYDLRGRLIADYSVKSSRQTGGLEECMKEQTSLSARTY